MIIQDQLQREIHLEGKLRRIVSLVPSQTELLCDLGLEDHVVGVTKFCVHPSHIRKSSEVVGGTKEVHLDKIRELRPDIILCNKEENTEEMVAKLEEIAPVHVSDVITFEDSLELIGDYGKIFGVEHLTIKLIEELQNAKNSFGESLKKRRKLKVAYFIWKEPWMMAGDDTFINTLMEINGWENVCRGMGDRYPALDINDLGSLQPELVLLSSEPFPFKEKHKEEISQYFKGRTELVDGEFFSWYGSRLLPAFDYFKEFQMKLSNLR